MNRRPLDGRALAVAREVSLEARDILREGPDGRADAAGDLGVEVVGQVWPALVADPVDRAPSSFMRTSRPARRAQRDVKSSGLDAYSPD